jgi:hypothetical protein
VAVEEPTPRRSDRVRLAALAGAIASAVLVAAFFFPWIRIPEADRGRLRDVLKPGLEDLKRTHPHLTHGFEVVLSEIETTGSVSGVDLFVYSRAAREINKALLEGSGGEDSKPRRAPDDLALAVRARRAFTTASIVLVALPVAALLLTVHFVAHGFRRARSPTLILLTVAGFVGMALAISWLRFAHSLGVVRAFTGDGLRATLGASVAQLACGVFGVTGRNWWRVYVGSLVTFFALSIVAYAYVWKGMTP